MCFLFAIESHERDRLRERLGGYKSRDHTKKKNNKYRIGASLLRVHFTRTRYIYVCKMKLMGGWIVLVNLVSWIWVAAKERDSSPITNGSYIKSAIGHFWLQVMILWGGYMGSTNGLPTLCFNSGLTFYINTSTVLSKSQSKIPFTRVIIWSLELLTYKKLFY